MTCGYSLALLSSEVKGQFLYVLDFGNMISKFAFEAKIQYKYPKNNPINPTKSFMDIVLLPSPILLLSISKLISYISYSSQMHRQMKEPEMENISPEEIAKG